MRVRIDGDAEMAAQVQHVHPAGRRHRRGVFVLSRRFEQFSIRLQRPRNLVAERGSPISMSAARTARYIARVAGDGNASAKVLSSMCVKSTTRTRPPVVALAPVRLVAPFVAVDTEFESAEAADASVGDVGSAAETCLLYAASAHAVTRAAAIDRRVEDGRE